MPLKHPTETVLVFLLGLVTILTGFVLTTLPDLPPGILPWFIVFVLTLAYPAALYPLLKNNRADYEFRLLHFAPAFMALLWLVLSVASLRFPAAAWFQHVYLFGWTLPLVTIAFLLLVLFCLNVIRRRVSRLVLLAILFVPYVALALTDEVKFHGSAQIASALWQGSWWNITGAQQGSEPSASGKNLAFSSYPDEEQWRQKLRQFEEGRSSTSAVASSSSKSSSSSIRSSLSSSSSSFVSSSSSSSVSSSSIVRSSSSSTSSLLAYAQASSSSKPPHLPSAGPEEISILAVSLGGLYMGVLHARAKRRMNRGV